MIKLTMHDGTETYLNPDHVVEIYVNNSGDTLIETSKGDTIVTESPEEVVRKIMEYKLALERFRVEYAEAAKHHGDAFYLSEVSEATVKKIAGLEEPQDA